jgi:sugar fermentation stimulation protein A
VELSAELVRARFIARPNRFTAAVEVGGRRVTAHLPNTGRLGEILVPGRQVFLAPAKNPHRKTAFTLVLAEMDVTLVSVDSGAPNVLAYEYLKGRSFVPFSAYDTIRREVTLPGGRYDLLLTHDGLPSLVVEVKGVTLVRDGCALFPDAPTARGTRHLEGLAQARARGLRAAVLFVVTRPDADSFSPNEGADGRFTAALSAARAVGVEAYAFVSRVTRRGAEIIGEIPIVGRESVGAHDRSACRHPG